MDKSKKTAIWGMLFAYFAISKIFYWYNTILSVLSQGEFREAWTEILGRFLSQDVLIIAGILIVFGIEKFVDAKMSTGSKTRRQIIEHIITFALIVGVMLAYFGVVNLFIRDNGGFDLIGGLIYGSIGYLIVAIVFEVKSYLKKKQMAKYISDLDADEKLTMLKALHDSGILTKEEYDTKRSNIY